MNSVFILNSNYIQHSCQMDPSKRIGKIKEQVELENISRRRYPAKWGKLTDLDVNRFYSQAEVSKILQAINKEDDKNNKDIWPFAYTGHGDSYFLPKYMFEPLVAKCRCGRPRTEGHPIKCLQKVQSKYNDDYAEDAANGDDIGKGLPSSSSTIASGDDGSGKSETELKQDGGNGRKPIPQTTNGMIGWPKSRYTEWEKSTKYISPQTKLCGPKVTANPYNVIFIG